MSKAEYYNDIGEDGLRYHQRRYRNNKEKRLAANKECVQRQKEKLFELLGGKTCRCCGETDEGFLTFDHINGGGTAHRKSLPSHNNYWGTMAKDPEAQSKYQVLCYNCNYGRSRSNGICPHQKENDHRMG